MTFSSLLVLFASLNLGAPRTLSVQDALDMVSKDHPRVRAAGLQLQAAGDARRSMRGRMLPALRVSDNQTWAYIHIDNMASFAGIPIRAGLLAASPQNFQVNMLSVGAFQPLLGLLHMSQDYLALDASVDAEQAMSQATRADVRLQVRTTFLRLFEAEDLAQTAAESEQDLREQVLVTKNKFDAGTQTLADVLRIKVAAASAQQDVIRSQAQAKSVRAALIELLGLGPDDDTLQFLPPTQLQSPLAPTTSQVIRSEALDKRPELRGAVQHRVAAERRVAGKTLALLPEVNLTGGYMHAMMAPMDFRDTTALKADVWMVGLAGEWNVWEWGASWYARQQAQAEAGIAQAQEEDARRQVATEVAARQNEALAAMAAIEVAQAQIGAASEAYRVTQALSGAGSATTTDLLDAQSALTEARTALVRARYEAAIATVTLGRAAGRDD